MKLKKSELKKLVKEVITEKSLYVDGDVNDILSFISRLELTMKQIKEEHVKRYVSKYKNADAALQKIDDLVDLMVKIYHS